MKLGKLCSHPTDEHVCVKTHRQTKPHPAQPQPYAHTRTHTPLICLRYLSASSSLAVRPCETDPTDIFRRGINCVARRAALPQCP